MAIGKDEIRSRFSQHRAELELDQQQQRIDHLTVQEEFIAISKFLDSILPDGRAKDISMTHLEDASMWANKAIAHQHPVVPDRPLR